MRSISCVKNYIDETNGLAYVLTKFFNSNKNIVKIYEYNKTTLKYDLVLIKEIVL